MSLKLGYQRNHFLSEENGKFLEQSVKRDGRHKFLRNVYVFNQEKLKNQLLLPWIPSFQTVNSSAGVLNRLCFAVSS